jgi:arylsulfatase A-like enzyme
MRARPVAVLSLPALPALSVLLPALLAPCCSLAQAQPQLQAPRSAQPNVLIILADDLGYSDLGSLGGEIATPRLDALAAEGLLFTRFYANASCSPTRAMLLSGSDNHVAGVGMMYETRGRAPADADLPETHDGYLNLRVAALPEVLSANGYTTIMAGKWHLGYEPRFYPDQRGFDRSFALLEGGASHFKQDNMSGLQGWSTTWIEDGVPVELPDDFYSSRSLTDYLIEQIDAATIDAPFFAYAAYTAPHWPIQAPDEDIARYHGRYDAGYAAIMNERLARQRALGLARVDSPAEPAIEQTALWDSMNADERAASARMMEAYAGMVTALDREIGRLIDHLRETERYDDTVILFLSDNGAEGYVRATPEFAAQFDNSLDNLGRPDSFVEYGAGWAQIGTTPNRMWKLTGFEGGNRVPAFVHYPGRVQAGRTDALATIMDLYPTVLELTGVEAPGERFQGRLVAPVQGRSLLPLLLRQASSVHADDAVFGFEVNGQASLHAAQWKIVYSGRLTDSRWQLFDMDSADGERADLSFERPDKLASMLELWRSFAARNGVLTAGEDAHPWLGY